MKRIKKVLSCLLVMALLLGTVTAKVAASESSVALLPTDEFLIHTGMPLDEIASMDPDIKEYIVQNLKQNAELEELEYVETTDIPVPTTLSVQVLSGISFSASAWKSGNIIYIYPTYEYTTPKKQAGKDSFAFELGASMRPYEFGGQVWTKLEPGNDWSKYGDMVANQQKLTGAEYSGTQLGNSPFSIYVKGAAYCHANVGTGTDKRIAMTYMNNPNKVNYSISFSVYGFGITFYSNDVIYTASKISTLSF